MEVIVTKGNYRHKIITMTDADAATAIADGWALDPAEEAVKEQEAFAAAAARQKAIDEAHARGEMPPEEEVAPTAEPPASWPDSLVNFEANIALGGTSLDEGTTEPPDENGGGPTPPPPPVLSSLDPDTAELGSADVTMHVYGSGFTANSVIYFADQPEPIVFISASEITTVVRPSLPWGAVTVQCYVRESGVDSNALDFTFTEAAAP